MRPAGKTDDDDDVCLCVLSCDFYVVQHCKCLMSIVIIVYELCMYLFKLTLNKT